MKLLLFSCEVMSNSFVTPWTTAHQVPLFMEFPRWEYWTGLRFSSPGYLSNPGIKPMSPALAGRFFIPEPSEITYCIVKDKMSCIQTFLKYSKLYKHSSLFIFLVQLKGKGGIYISISLDFTFPFSHNTHTYTHTHKPLIFYQIWIQNWPAVFQLWDFFFNVTNLEHLLVQNCPPHHKKLS